MNKKSLRQRVTEIGGKPRVVFCLGKGINVEGECIRGCLWFSFSLGSI